MKALTTAISALLLAFFITAPAMSAERAGIIMLDTQMVGDQQLWINGTALREKFFVDVYVAALYLKEKSSDPKAILAQDEPRMMVMHFVYDVSAEKISKAWYEGLEANVDPVSPELKAKFDQLAGMMEGIKEGEAMSFTYDPGKGTTVMVKGQAKGTIQGKDFADAILATWIGPKPGPGKSFKNDLLGK